MNGHGVLIFLGPVETSETIRELFALLKLVRKVGPAIACSGLAGSYAALQGVQEGACFHIFAPCASCAIRSDLPWTGRRSHFPPNVGHCPVYGRPACCPHTPSCTLQMLKPWTGDWTHIVMSQIGSNPTVLPRYPQLLSSAATSVLPG